MSKDSPDDLRAARDNTSVLKIGLAKIREIDRCRIVIVLEGREDLPVYENWITRLSPSYVWEPLLAKGKRKLLEFRELLGRDQTGLAVCTYFIADSDYDGLRGSTPGTDLYLLPAYSVENFLTDERVLDSYLKTDLRMVGEVSERARIVGIYVRAREAFMASVRPACVRLFGARNEDVGNVRVNDLRNVLEIGDDEVLCLDTDWTEELVSTDKEISAEGLAKGEDYFCRASLPLWVRGKFMLGFFKMFCALLYSDRLSTAPRIFAHASVDRSIAPGALDLGNLASKSVIPDGLAETISRWARDCETTCQA